MIGPVRIYHLSTLTLFTVRLIHLRSSTDPPGGDVGFSIVPTDALTRRLEQQRFDPPSVCSHPEHTRM